MVVGRGRLGTSLARALGAQLLPGRGFGPRVRQIQPDSLVLLAVPDPALAELAAAIAHALGSAGDRPLEFAHLSGALGLEPLLALRESGHPVGSMHPLQSFPTVREPAAFTRSVFAIEASDPQLEDRLAAVARSLGGFPRTVAGADQRTLYHAAAVLASNYLVALAGQATQVLEGIGWERSEALGALLPLMSGVLESLSTAGLPEALIGPIRRGDPDTVVRHLAALRNLPPGAPPYSHMPARTYRMLGLAALELAQEAGLEPRAASRIAEALTGDGSDQEVTQR